MRDTIEGVSCELKGVVSVLDVLLEAGEDEHTVNLYQLLRNVVDRCSSKLDSILEDTKKGGLPE